MDRNVEQITDRRRFLRTAAGCIVACAATAATVVLIGKGGASGFTCLDADRRCDDCSLAKSCRLPEALEARGRRESN